MPVALAEVVPQSAIATGYVVTAPRAWAELANLPVTLAESSGNSFALENALLGLKIATIPRADVHYAEDIQPWIDGAMGAIVPDADGSMQWIAVMGVKDRGKAEAFVQKVHLSSMTNPNTQDINGVSVTETTQNPDRPLFSAIIDNRLILAGSRSAMESAIATHNGQPAYADNPKVKTLRDRPLSLKNPVFAWEVPDFAAFQKAMGSDRPALNSPLAIAPAYLSSLDTVDSLAVGAGTVDRGLHLQGMVHLTQELPPSAAKTGDNRAIARFPENTLALVSSRDIAREWKNFSDRAAADPDLKDVTADIRQKLGMAGLDADRDVFGWLDGEFAVGVVNIAAKPEEQVKLSGLVVLETSDRATGEQSIDKLTRTFKLMPQLGVADRQIDNINLTEWSIPTQGVMLSYGWLDGQEWIATLGASYEDFIRDRPKSLAQSDRFRSLTRDLPPSNSGTLYLDLEQLQLASDRVPLLPRPFDSNQQALLAALKGIALTLSQPSAQTQQVDVRITLRE
jgi:hypothetical protein